MWCTRHHGIWGCHVCVCTTTTEKLYPCPCISYTLSRAGVATPHDAISRLGGDGHADEQASRAARPAKR